MRIEQVMRGCGLLVQLTPDDCYTLAAACRSAAAEHEERAKGGDELSRRGHLYDTFAAALEGYALAGAAPGYMGAQEGARFTTVRIHPGPHIHPGMHPSGLGEHPSRPAWPTKGGITRRTAIEPGCRAQCRCDR